MSEGEREKAIEAELLSGDIPGFLRQLAPVRLAGKLSGGRMVDITICVLPDYLAIGSDRDYLLVPMRLATALSVAERYGFMLPTAKMVDAIYAQAAVQLAPQPLPAGDRMRSTDYYRRHEELIDEQRTSLGAEPGALTSGDKKDLVITNRLWTNLARVAIYGWHRALHDPIQPLSTVHGAHYADYSHGVRLVSATAYMDGQPRSILDILTDPELAGIVSGEGPIRGLRGLLTILETIRVGSEASLAGNSRNVGAAR